MRPLAECCLTHSACLDRVPLACSFSYCQSPASARRRDAVDSHPKLYFQTLSAARPRHGPRQGAAGQPRREESKFGGKFPRTDTDVFRHALASRLCLMLLQRFALCSGPAGRGCAGGFRTSFFRRAGRAVPCRAVPFQAPTLTGLARPAWPGPGPGARPGQALTRRGL